MSHCGPLSVDLTNLGALVEISESFLFGYDLISGSFVHRDQVLLFWFPKMASCSAFTCSRSATKATLRCLKKGRSVDKITETHAGIEKWPQNGPFFSSPDVFEWPNWVQVPGTQRALWCVQRGGSHTRGIVVLNRKSPLCRDGGKNMQTSARCTASDILMLTFLGSMLNFFFPLKNCFLPMFLLRERKWNEFVVEGPLECLRRNQKAYFSFLFSHKLLRLFWVGRFGDIYWIPIL